MAEIRPYAPMSWETPTVPPRSLVLATARLRMRFGGARDAAALAAAYRDNFDWLGQWEPWRPEEWWSEDFQRTKLEEFDEHRENDRAYRFLAFAADTRRDDGEALVGMATLTGIVRGPFQSAHLGYWVAERWIRQGLGAEMVGAVVEWGLGAGALHRIEAAVQPENEASIRLIKSIGFRHIGLAERYLHIAGAWRDHEIFERVAR